MQTKKCKTCGIDKSITEFHKSTVGAKGVIAHCKECHNWAVRSPKDREIELERQRCLKEGVQKCACCQQILPFEKFPLNKKRRSGRKSYCYDCQRAKALEISRREDIKQKKKERESTREFLDNLSEYRKNSSKYKETITKYRKTSTVFKEYQKEYGRRPYVKVRRDLSTRIWQELKLYGRTKQSSYDEYLGCSIEFFFNYLEGMFMENMSWENWGRGSDKWHADHIKACAEFNMYNEDEVKKCFHYSNYQPLWEPDNLRKSSKNAEGKKVFKRYSK